MLSTTLGLYKNELITAMISDDQIVFSDKTIIWLMHKYYPYGTLGLYRGNQVTVYKTSIKTIKEIMELEKNYVIIHQTHCLNTMIEDRYYR